MDIPEVGVGQTTRTTPGPLQFPSRPEGAFGFGPSGVAAPAGAEHIPVVCLSPPLVVFKLFGKRHQRAVAHYFNRAECVVAVPDGPVTESDC